MSSKKSRRAAHRAIGVITGCTLLPPGDQPAMYTGPLPSFEFMSFIQKVEREHAEWQRRRAEIKGWVYNPATGNAEPEPLITPSMVEKATRRAKALRKQAA